MLLSLLQKHMKVHRMRYILYIGVSCGTPCSIALSIVVVSAGYQRKAGQTINSISFVGAGLKPAPT